jgi:hypothetical protein
MTLGTARPPALVITAIVLFSVSSIMGQTAGQRGNRGTSSSPPADAPSRGAGTVPAPEGGYVPPPESTPAGTVYPAPIPSDEFDRAYWELYDRDKHVTIRGKVTKVNWTNPNAYIFVMANGTGWAVEASFVQFRQASVTPAVRADQTISVSGYLAKEDPKPKWPVKSATIVSSYQKSKHLIRASEITTEYGQKLKLGRPLTESEERDELLKCSRLGC